MIFSCLFFVQTFFHLTLTLFLIFVLIVAVNIFWSTNVNAKNSRSFVFHSMIFLIAWSIVSFSEISMWAEIQWMCAILLRIFKCFNFVIMRCNMNWSNCCLENLMIFIAVWLSIKIMIENCCVSAIFSANLNFMNFSKYTVSFVKSSTYVCFFFHYYWCFSFYWNENRHREDFYFIFYVIVIREYRWIIVFYDLIMNFDDCFDDWNYDNFRWLSSKKCWKKIRFSKLIMFFLNIVTYLISNLCSELNWTYKIF